MFREANTIARNFVRPVVVSRRRADGTCSAGIGTYVVVNRDGWIVTAGHIVNQLLELGRQCDAFRAVQPEIERIKNDPKLNHKARRKALAALKLLPETDQTTDFSAWWGQNGLTLRDAYVIGSTIDVAVG